MNDIHRRAYPDVTNVMIQFGLASILYCLYFFVILKLPIVGTPTFRIDYLATTITRANDDLSVWLLHARPVSGLFVYFQGKLASLFFSGQSKYIIYPLQHVALIIYFLAISKVIESIYKTKLKTVTFIVSWLLFMTSPGVIQNIYKLETIVGTLSMFFASLSLLFLVQWSEKRRTSTAILFVISYALSIFAKEDMALPPLALLAWYLWSDGNWKSQLKAHKWLLIAIFSLLAFFVVFNELMIPNRSYMDPAKQVNAPYFMTLNPLSLIKVASFYIWDLGLEIKLLTLIYLAIFLAAITLRVKWRETLFVALVISSMMAPYLIMPNHLFAYYGLKWLVWQVLASMILVQIIFSRRSVTVVLSVGLAVLAPEVRALYSHQDFNWYQSNYFRNHFTVSKNVFDTLSRERDTLNSYRQVAVLGIGPGGIDQSPWQGNGETAFYLSGDLGLTPQWIVFVKSSDPSYRIENNVDPNANPERRVVVKSISQLGAYPEIPRLAFDATGNGSIVGGQ